MIKPNFAKIFNFVKKVLTARVAIFFLSLMTGIIIGVIYERKNLPDYMADINPIREKDYNYKFIQPLLSFRIPSAENNEKFKTLESKINNLIEQKKSQKMVSEVAFYFHALNEGRWVGINETEKYNPASLLKVVIMIVYLKESEKDPLILTAPKVYTSQINDFISGSAFSSASSLKVSQSYSVQELIEKMIIDSDNGAMYLLSSSINEKEIEYLYNSLGIKPAETMGQITISPRIYSLFFRVLYNATYLNRVLSEKALAILARTTFDDGLVADLPKETAVAHKFGEFVISENNIQTSAELHDCGIVYYLPSPYFICVMTKGSDIEKLKNVVRDISNLVYQEFKNLSKN